MSLVILPSIDLRNGKVVRLKQGDYSQQINYDVEPMDVAASYAKAGAKWMHVIDLDGAKEGKPVQLEILTKLAAASGLQVQIGGGIRTEDDIQRLLQAGAARVVVGTRAMQDWDWFTKLIHNPKYNKKITLALDAKNGIVATHGWTETSSTLAVDVAKKVNGWPLAAILYTDVAKDGMLTGPNFEQTRQLAEATDVPVIASGGVGSIDHIRALTTMPVWGVIVGRSLYEGKVDLAEAIEVASASRRWPKTESHNAALTENDVIEATCRHLSKNGWKIVSQCKTSEQGVDVVAVRENGTPLHIEAKGATSASESSARFGMPFNSNQIKSHISRAFYTAAACIGVDVRSAIALPETKLHLRYLEPLRNSLSKLGILVFLVAEDHSVREW